MRIELFGRSDFEDELSNANLDEFIDENGEFIGYEGRFEELCEDLSEYANNDRDSAISTDFWEAYSQEISDITWSFLRNHVRR